MPTLSRRALVAAASVTAVVAASLTLGASPAAAAGITPTSIPNTATAQVVTVTTSGLSLGGGASMSITSPDKRVFTATNVTGGGLGSSAVSGTFNLDPNGLPAGPGTYALAASCGLLCTAQTGNVTVTGSPPAPTSITPNNLAANQSSTAVTINGTGFTLGDLVTFSDPNVVFTPNYTTSTATALKGTLSITGATLTTDSLTVRATDGSTGTCANCLTVRSFVVSSTSPTSLQNIAGAQALQVTGVGFTSGDHYKLTLTRDPATPGQNPITTDGVATATTWSGSVTVIDDAPGQYDMTLTDDSHPTQSGGCTSCFQITPSGVPTLTAVTPAQVPAGATTNVAVTGHNLFRGATISFPVSSGLTAGASSFVTDSTGAITSIVVPVTVATAAAAGTPVSLTLTNPPASTTSVDPQQTATLANALTVGSPGTPTTITLIRNKSNVTYGQRVTVGGRLTVTGGAALAGQQVLLGYKDDAGHNHVLEDVTTDSTGIFSLTYAPTMNSKYVAAFLGTKSSGTTPGYAASTASTARTTVSPVVTIVVQKHESVSTKLVVTGSVTPSRAGKKVTLYRYTASGDLKKLATTVLSSTSTYAFATRALGKGKFALVVVVSAVKNSAAGESKTVTVRRS